MTLTNINILQIKHIYCVVTSAFSTYNIMNELKWFLIKHIKGISPGWPFKSNSVYATQTLFSHQDTIFTKKESLSPPWANETRECPACIFVLQTRVYFSARQEKTGRTAPPEKNRRESGKTCSGQSSTKTSSAQNNLRAAGETDINRSADTYSSAV